MKRKVALTVAGASASLISVAALQRRGILPQVKIDPIKAKQAVKISRVQGKHAPQSFEDDNLK